MGNKNEGTCTRKERRRAEGVTAATASESVMSAKERTAQSIDECVL